MEVHYNRLNKKLDRLLQKQSKHSKPPWQSSFLTSAQDSHLQTVMIPEAACIQLRRRPPDDEQGDAWNM
jgi:hypothetical protein